MNKNLLLFLSLAFPSVSLSAQVASIGDNTYESLDEAFNSAEENSTIKLLADVEVSTMIPVTKSVTLDLDGRSITNNVESNRLFRLSGVTFTINGNNGSITIPESNTKSFGFVDFRDASDNASADTKLSVSNTSFSGATNGGSLFALRANGQSISMDNVNVTLNESNTYSIINGYQQQVDINVSGGEYICNSTNKTAGVFQAGAGSTISFEDVNVTSSVGPIFEVKSKASFTNCNMQCTATNSYFATCIAASNGGDITVNDGTYEANYPFYVYNSGGTINIDGAEATGKVAAIKIDDSTTDNKSSVTVSNGSFNGDLSVGSASELSISGGSFSDPAAANYCEDGYSLKETIDAEGNTKYEVEATPTGISEISTDNIAKDNRIFTLQGVFVGHSLDSLPAGIYIKGNKKILVR